jgi:hypothetical protein
LPFVLLFAVMVILLHLAIKLEFSEYNYHVQCNLSFGSLIPSFHSASLASNAPLEPAPVWCSRRLVAFGAMAPLPLSTDIGINPSQVSSTSSPMLWEWTSCHGDLGLGHR